MQSHTASLALGLICAGILPAQSQHIPVFEVASIKACKPGEVSPGMEIVAGTGKVAAPETASQSPGTLRLNCMPLRHLMKMAYLDFAGGRRNILDSLGASVGGGPDWVDSDRYAILAKSPEPANPPMMRGPMLQALLEDRFQLKLRRESRETEVYELTVAKGGVKMKRSAEGSCVPRDPDQPGLPPKAPDGKPWCSTMHYFSSRTTMTGIVDGTGVTSAEMAPYLGTGGRPVIDNTGLEGRFDFHLEYLRAGGPPPQDPDPSHAAPSIFNALETVLGLKLTPARRRVDVLVVDHVEKPSVN